MIKLISLIVFSFYGLILYSQNDTLSYDRIFFEIPDNLSIIETKKIILKNKLFKDIQLTEKKDAIQARYIVDNYLCTNPESIIFRRIPLITRDTNKFEIDRNFINVIHLVFSNSDTVENKIDVIHRCIIKSVNNISFNPITKLENSNIIVGYVYFLDTSNEMVSFEIMESNIENNCILIYGNTKKKF